MTLRHLYDTVCVFYGQCLALGIVYLYQVQQICPVPYLFSHLSGVDLNRSHRSDDPGKQLQRQKSRSVNRRPTLLHALPDDYVCPHCPSRPGSFVWLQWKDVQLILLAYNVVLLREAVQKPRRKFFCANTAVPFFVCLFFSWWRSKINSCSRFPLTACKNRWRRLSTDSLSPAGRTEHHSVFVQSERERERVYQLCSL